MVLTHARAAAALSSTSSPALLSSCYYDSTVAPGRNSPIEEWDGGFFRSPRTRTLGCCEYCTLLKVLFYLKNRDGLITVLHLGIGSRSLKIQNRNNNCSYGGEL